MTIIDCDTHIIEPSDLFRPYASIHGIGISTATERLPELPPGYEQSLTNNNSISTKPSDYDSIQINILFPTAGLYAMALNSLSYTNKSRVARLYNYYMREYVLGQPHLRYVLLQSTLDLPDTSSPSCVGICLNHSALPYHVDSGKYDGIYAVAEARNIPICFHTVAGCKPAGDFTNPLEQHVAEAFTTTSRTILDLILGGVFTRFPKLKVGFFESNALWARSYMIRIANHLNGPWNVVNVPKDAWKYVRDNMYFALDENEAKLISPDDPMQYLYASDFPHADASTEHIPDIIAETLNINARRFYGL